MWSCCSALLSCLQGRTPLEGRMRPEGVSSQPQRWPSGGPALDLSHRGEQLDVEECVPEPAVE